MCPFHQSPEVLPKRCMAIGTTFLPHRQTAQNTQWKEKYGTENPQAREVIFQNTNPA